MKKILCTHSYFYKLDPKQWGTYQPYPPLGTIYAAAVLREEGYNVVLHDSNLCDGPEAIKEILRIEKPDYLIIYDDGFNYLTKMCLTVMREAALAIQQFGKQDGCIVITCSSDSTDHYELYLENGADFVIRGEGEITLIDLISNLEAGIEVSSIEGLAFKSENGIKLTPKRQILKDLDLLPFPTWDLIDIRSYRSIWLSHHKHFYLNVATTRGCPFKCNWCAKPIYGNRYNSRSPQSVTAELAYLNHKFNAQYFWMCDDIFGLKPGWVMEFRKQLELRGLKIKYKIQTRADLLLEEDTIETLVASGLDEAWLGAESGSQSILDAMDKGIRVEQIYQATHLLKSRGVKVGLFIQFGYLGETAKDVRKTIRMVLDLMPDQLGVSVSYPLPGTLFYEKVKDELKSKANWVDSADLDLMFHNTYSQAYYKILHKFLHRLYRAKKSRIEFFERLKKMELNLKPFLRWN
ncbi:MAG: B12-binding domain-containing radical SAM protein, partial [Flammeovirgaceae bacterium]|nr:B12-binding domain-containing radical SAM protein [Flammeovirgaceae bacterium]